MENPQQYIEINKDWFWFFNEFHEESVPQQFEEDTPRCSIIHELVFEC